MIEEVRKFAESLRGRYSVFLVGSYARGDFNVWSDVDVVVVGEFKGNPLQRLRELDAPPGFELIPLTEEELMDRVTKRDPLALELVNYGVPVRDDFHLARKLKPWEKT
ncbi:nucleotidyltransferase domain-containing protein [Infirmifilum lucidum]|uniref:Nucleotidyltransferase domain-containing protein n=1 Tax=Infirmifilum lucidum TaxID=2776706 RepID=A0A7L9FJ97_9CREN|nr:nucleotidyltransferase domain-containing protein [Infirmifilum lucidum]